MALLKALGFFVRLGAKAFWTIHCPKGKKANRHVASSTSYIAERINW